MIEKTAYSKTSGEILYSVTGDKKFLITEETDEVGFVDGSYSSDAYKVVDGSVIRKPDSEIEEQEIQSAWVQLKAERNRRLFATDWTQVSDAPVDHQAWAVYRQQLRDLPANTPDPRYPVWPSPPS
jgi:hypothetical protein